jgi:hypothetical protein
LSGRSFGVIAEPRPLDHAAALRCGSLLILAGEIVFANGPADLLEHLGRLALGMQCLARPPREPPLPPHRLDHKGLVVLGDCREAHDLPILLAQNVADQIILVQPVHDQDDRTLPLVIEATVEGMVEPLVCRPPLALRQRLFGFQRIIDDDQVGAAPGQDPANRGGEPATKCGRLELRHGLALRGKPGQEGALIPVAGHDAPAVARQLVGEILRVADTEDLLARLTPETPGRKRHRAQQRFQIARRHIDDQPPDLALAHRSELCRDDFDVPVHRNRGHRVQLAKTALRKSGEIEPQLRLLLARCQRRAVHRRGYGHCSRPSLAPLAGRGTG